MAMITFRIDDRLARLLDRLSKQSGRPKSELIREALQRQLALTRFEDLRQRTAPFAEARGWLTDEDVFRELL
ncbi:MAG: ribbon-helix-helix protein, CopG family [Acidiferrobacterales bacterium]